MPTPGVSVAFGCRTGVVWTAGFGFANVERQTPATDLTIYRLASISKPIAATALMQQVEQGRVKLDQPVQNWLPEFPVKPEGSITLRHLLTHTSGIRHYRGTEVFSNRRYDSVEAALVIFKDDPLEFKPGTKYQYSSYGYNTLAAVVEMASGETFRTYLRSYLFGPAGMTSTDLEFLEEASPNRCVQYVAGVEEGTFVPARRVDLSNKWAGGGMCGTAGDLVRFCAALDNAKLLRPETLELMRQPMLLDDGSVTKYGLGWQLLKDSQGRLWAAHSGGATGGTTYLIHNPQHGISVAILCNAQNVKGLSGLALKLGEALLP